MINPIVFWGLCAVLILVPLPIGSVEEWSTFAFEAATIGLFLLYVGGRLFGRKGAGGRDQAPGSDQGRAAQLPPFFKVLLGAFLVVSALQIVPLPAGLIRILSPRAYGIYAGLVRDAVIAPSSWLTLSLSPGATVYELALLLCYGLFGYLILRTVHTRGRAEILVVVILAAALFQAFYGMAETFSGHEMIFGRPKRYNLGSVTGTYVNRNHFSGFLEMAFPLSLGYLLVKARYFAMERGLSLRRRILWFGQESLQWTLLLGLVPVFIGVGLIFSKSRSGILVLAVTAVLAAVAAASWRQFSGADGEAESIGGESHRRFGQIVRLVMAFVLAVAVWIGIGPVIRRFSEVDITAESRRTFYKNTIEMIGDFPWTGTGKGTYVNAYAMYEKVDDGLRLSFAHNDYLEFASENGIIGGGALAFAGIGLLVWLAACWRRRRDPFAKGVGLGAMLGVAALLIHGFTDFNLQITANAVYFATLAMLGVAVLTGYGKRREDLKNDRKGAKKGNTYRKDTSPIKLLVAGVLAVAILIPAFRDFLGFHYLNGYRRARGEARSVESAFPVLEELLGRATRSSSRAVFQMETARLYMEMARVANESGREEERDTFCDRAVVRYGQAIAANPIDAAVLYETGTTYLLYNFPLMTYQDRAKAYFRQALVFKPADATINLNVQFLYFTWWPTLEEADRKYAAGLYRAMAARDPAFPAELEGRWTRTYGSPDALRAILDDLPKSQ